MNACKAVLHPRCRSLITNVFNTAILLASISKPVVFVVGIISPFYMLVSLSLETQRDQSISNHVLYYQCKWKWEFSLFSLSLHYGSWWWSWISNSKKKVSSSSYTGIVCCYFFAKSNKTTVVKMTTVPIGLVFLLAFSACNAVFMKNESECYYVEVLEASFLFWKTHITVGTTEVLPTVLLKLFSSFEITL